MFNIFLFCFFFLAATCTGEQQSKFFVLLQLLSLQPPLPSLMCLGESVSVHFEMTNVCDSAQRVCKCQRKQSLDYHHGCSFLTFRKGNIMFLRVGYWTVQRGCYSKEREQHWEQRLWRFNNEDSSAERGRQSDETQCSWSFWPKIKALMLMCSYKNPKLVS